LRAAVLISSTVVAAKSEAEPRREIEFPIESISENLLGEQ
jgi:hypothetical protein